MSEQRGDLQNRPLYLVGIKIKVCQGSEKSCRLLGCWTAGTGAEEPGSKGSEEDDKACDSDQDLKQVGRDPKGKRQIV